MNTLTARLRRFSRITVASLSLMVLAVSVCLAEGWGDIGGPPSSPPSTVTSSHVVYLDGSELTATGTYTSGGVSHSVPAASYDGAGNLNYSEGTVLHPDGSWSHYL
jgi:hypothetical protein